MSSINRGPLGSAFLINRDPSGNGNGANPTARPVPATPSEPIGSTANPTPTAPPGPTPRTTGSTTSGPTLSAAGAIPMPGPTSTPAPLSSDGPAMATSSHGSFSGSATATMEPPAKMAAPGAVPVPPPRGSLVTTDLVRSLAEVKGQAQFLLYLADQIEDSLQQLIEEHDDCQNAFLCRILSMYSAQLETKHHGLGDKISETCQEVYVTVRDYDAT